ncbi:unnamed protein product [Mytilus coruscus]|uniref:Uncharacterized protein n=1 Tax=Mytilus coruscus TaxID=42192 RepID=A0A6J8DAT4_MYTCO|nr:unnamed protein product [Mytilus coruscus]
MDNLIKQNNTKRRRTLIVGKTAADWKPGGSDESVGKTKIKPYCFQSTQHSYNISSPDTANDSVCSSTSKVASRRAVRGYIAASCSKPMTQTAQPIPATMVPSSAVQSFLIGNLHPVVRQKPKPVPVTIAPNSVAQSCLTGNLQPAVGKTIVETPRVTSEFRTAQNATFTYANTNKGLHLEAPASPQQNLEGYDPERP